MFSQRLFSMACMGLNMHMPCWDLLVPGAYTPSSPELYPVPIIPAPCLAPSFHSPCTEQRSLEIKQRHQRRLDEVLLNYQAKGHRLCPRRLPQPRYHHGERDTVTVALRKESGEQWEGGQMKRAIAVMSQGSRQESSGLPGKYTIPPHHTACAFGRPLPSSRHRCPPG